MKSAGIPVHTAFQALLEIACRVRLLTLNIVTLSPRLLSTHLQTMTSTLQVKSKP